MHFITDIINIFGFKLVSDGQSPKTRDQTPLFTNIACSIQPAGTDIFTLFPDGIDAAQAFVVYIRDTSIKIKNGYRLVDQMGREFIVRGVPEVWTTANSRTNHVKVAVERVVDY